MENRNFAKLTLKDFLSQEDIDSATAVWIRNRTRKGKAEPSQEQIAVVRRLALELFLPLLESVSTLNFRHWDMGEEGYEQYTRITEGFDKKELVGIEFAAVGLTERLYEIGLRKRMNSHPNVVRVDPDYYWPESNLEEK